MKNSTTIIYGLVGIILGLVVGYLIGINAAPGAGWMHGGGFMHNDNHMHGELSEHMNENDIIRQDGAMQHAMDEMMFGFRGKTGAAYEESFLRGMIVHHLGAVAMAEELLEQTERPELQEFGNDIISHQAQEVEQMQRWLDEWFDKNN
ncbi:MAG: DUF305 domain-containing protein [Candidatus Paceibacterota bacterium]